MKTAFKSILMIFLVLSLVSSCKKKTIEPESIKTETIIESNKRDIFIGFEDSTDIIIYCNNTLLNTKKNNNFTVNKNDTIKIIKYIVHPNTNLITFINKTKQDTQKVFLNNNWILFLIK